MASMLKRIREDLAPELEFFVRAALSALIDGGFLAFWVAVQYWVNQFIQTMNLTGADQIVFWVFQGILGVSTLAPVVFYIWKDVMVMYEDAVIVTMKSRRRIRAEREWMTLGATSDSGKEGAE